MTPAQEMDTAISVLENNYVHAQATVGSTFFFPLVGGGNSAEGTLYTAHQGITFLKGEFRTDVLAGRRAISEWRALADSVNRDLRTLESALPSLSWSGVAGGAFDDFKSDVKEVATVAGIGTLGIALVALAVLFMWQRAVRS